MHFAPLCLVPKEEMMVKDARGQSVFPSNPHRRV